MQTVSYFVSAYLSFQIRVNDIYVAFQLCIQDRRMCSTSPWLPLCPVVVLADSPFVDQNICIL